MVDAPNPQTYNARPILGPIVGLKGAGWSSLVARRAHNPKVVGSNPAPATKHWKRVIFYNFVNLLGLYEPLIIEEVF